MGGTSGVDDCCLSCLLSIHSLPNTLTRLAAR